MELTLAQISSIATGMVQGRTDVTASEASFYANLAYQEVATRIPFSSKEALAISSTTSGENRIALPSDFEYIIDVSNLSTQGAIGGPQLRQVQAEWIDSQETALGEPKNYAPYSTWLELWPSPDSSYSIQLRYMKKLPTLTASTDTPLVDDRFHYPIACLTAARIAASRQDVDSEALAMQRYLSIMQSTPSDQAYRQRTKTGQGLTVAWKREP